VQFDLKRDRLALKVDPIGNMLSRTLSIDLNNLATVSVVRGG